MTQPDRAAGRGRKLVPTPVARLAEEQGLEAIKTADVNDPAAVGPVRDGGADAFVVVAFGQKIGPAVLGDTFA
ncbi:MAG: methionyl-tRNA formyltransferase, partial [Planctomycetota bacterium]